MMSNIKAYIFDLDGVLTDTAEYHYCSWKKLCDQHNLIFDKNLNELLKGVSRNDSLKVILKHNNQKITDDTLEQWIDEKNNYYLEYINTITPDNLFPKVIDYLNKLKQEGIKIGLGSASKNARLVLDKLDIIDYFDIIGCGNSVERSKPAPDLFLFVANQLGLNPEECLVVEDSQAGIDSAKSANMKVIAIGSKKSLKTADYYYSSIAELNDGSSLYKNITHKNSFTNVEIANSLNELYGQFKSHALSINNLFYSEPDRAKKYSLNALGCYFDYSKNWITDQSLNLLFKIADENKLAEKIDAMFSGKKINITENRAVLHSALRDPINNNIIINNNNIFKSIKQTQQKIKFLCEQINDNKLLGFSGKKIKSIVNIGIGGSDLGPKMVYHALKPYWNNNIKCYFVSNVDPADIAGVLHDVDQESTLFIVSSKTFTTIETLSNANTARDWLLQKCSLADLKSHFVAITSATEKAVEYGIDKNNILPMWDWVGGRYSLWSTIGLSIALGTSFDSYIELLSGANDLDNHFKSQSWSENIPVIMALLGIGYINFAGAQSHALLPYCQNLNYFTSYVQQLDMESNGKTVDIKNQAINYDTGPIIWGAPGTNGQHAFHQLLHQGSHLIPCDFIVPIQSDYQPTNQQKILVANAFAQARTLLTGNNSYLMSNSADINNLYKLLPGNRPSNTILMNKLTPYSLGVLIATYEQKVFTQGALWNINSFDQWGVEHGKIVAKEITPFLDEQPVGHHFDPSTDSLINAYHGLYH